MLHAGLLCGLFRFASSGLNVEAEVYACEHCFTTRVTRSLNIIYRALSLVEIVLASFV
jgi:hypothetical protein